MFFFKSKFTAFQPGSLKVMVYLKVRQFYKNVNFPCPLITNLNQSLQLVELAVKIFKVVLVQGSEAIHIHDFDQHAEGLLLWHLKTQGKPVNSKTSRGSNSSRLTVCLFTSINKPNVSHSNILNRESLQSPTKTSVTLSKQN